MKLDEFHKLVRLNGLIKLRQMGTSHIIYKKSRQHILFHTTKERK